MIGRGREGDQVTISICRRWKADKMGVQCICCYGDGSALLTAGRAIKLWSLVDYTLIKVSCARLSRPQLISEGLGVFAESQWARLGYQSTRFCWEGQFPL